MMIITMVTMKMMIITMMKNNAVAAIDKEIFFYRSQDRSSMLPLAKTFQTLPQKLLCCLSTCAVTALDLVAKHMLPNPGRKLR